MNCNIVIMSVLTFCLAYMQLLKHTIYVVQLSSFEGKKIKTQIFHKWWQNLAQKWFTFWLVYSPLYKLFCTPKLRCGPHPLSSYLFEVDTYVVISLKRYKNR